jgi:hypothetical protein
MNDARDRKCKQHVILTEELLELLQNEAKRRTCSLSFLIREACQQLLSTKQEQEAA